MKEKKPDLDFKITKGKNPFDVKELVPGYFTKWVFRLSVGLLALLVFYTAFTNDFRNNFEYVSCPENSYIPCYVSEGTYKGTYLPPGASVGEKPNEDYFKFGDRVFLIILFAFVLNHFLYVLKNKKLVPEINRAGGKK